MRVIGAAEVTAALTYPLLIDALRDGFRRGAAVPLRHQHRIPVPGASDATLLLMPAWTEGQHVGVKLATVFPDNSRRSLPSIMGAYVLLDGTSGALLAIIDGPALTVRRTAAASALAATYLARPDAARLLVVGTGALAPQLALAHASARPIRDVRIWGRDAGKAQRLARRLSVPRARVAVADDLAAAVEGADIVSCATMASQPLVYGDWLQPGTHLDLVGAFTPQMQEADATAFARSQVYVDTRAGAFDEAGDLLNAIAQGALSPSAVIGDLFDLTRGAVPGRRTYSDITVFKSVGTALEDLVAARAAYLLT